MPGRQQVPSFQLAKGTTNERDGSYSLIDVGSIFYNTDTSNVEIRHEDPTNSLAWRDLVVNNRNGIDISGGEEYFRMFDRRETDIGYSHHTTLGYDLTSPGDWIETIAKGSGNFDTNGYTVQSNGMFLLHASIRARPPPSGGYSHATFDFYKIPSGGNTSSTNTNYYIDVQDHVDKFSNSIGFTKLKLVPSDYHYLEIQTLIELNAGDIVSVRRTSGNITRIRGVVFTVLKLR